MLMLQNLFAMMTDVISGSIPKIQQDALSQIHQNFSPIQFILSSIRCIMCGHTDSWCKKNCNPHLYSELNDICNILHYKLVLVCVFIWMPTLYVGWHRCLWTSILLVVTLRKNDEKDESSHIHVFHSVYMSTPQPSWNPKATGIVLSLGTIK